MCIMCRIFNFLQSIMLKFTFLSILNTDESVFDQYEY